MSSWSWIALATCVAILGCDGGGMSKSAVQSAQAAAEKAAELESRGSYAEALPLVSESILQGGLNPDQLSEAYLLRSRCQSALGKLEEAERDLEAAERGSPNPESWHFSRAILFAKQNKTAEAKSEFSKATRINPKLKMPN